MTKRGRDEAFDIERGPNRKNQKITHPKILIFPDVIENIIVQYFVDDPFEVFISMCVDGNQVAAKRLQKHFRFDKMGIERALQLKFTYQISLTKSVKIFDWYKKTFNVDYYPIECAAIAIDNNN